MTIPSSPRLSSLLLPLLASAALLTGCAGESTAADPPLLLIATADGTSAPLQLSACSSDGILSCRALAPIHACAGTLCETLAAGDGDEGLGANIQTGTLAASAPGTVIDWFYDTTKTTLASMVVPASLTMTGPADGSSFSASNDDLTLRWKPTADQDPIYVRTAISCAGGLWENAEQDVDDPASGQTIIPAGQLAAQVQGSCTAAFTVARYQRSVTSGAVARADQARVVNVTLIP